MEPVHWFRLPAIREAVAVAVRIVPKDHEATAGEMSKQQRFEVLALPYLDSLLGFARRRLGNKEDAEDVVQVALVRAWKGFAVLRDASAVRAWLFAILRTAVSDHLQQHASRRRIADVIPLEEAHEQLIEDFALGPFEELVRNLSSERLHQALAQIPPDYAIAVELHDIDGFRYREIVEIVGVPIGTVMSRIHRGRKLLAGILTRDNDGSDLSSWRPTH